MKSTILKSERLKNENIKLMADVMDQENFLNDMINILEKENLDAIVKKFSKISTL